MTQCTVQLGAMTTSLQLFKHEWTVVTMLQFDNKTVVCKILNVEQTQVLLTDTSALDRHLSSLEPRLSVTNTERKVLVV